MAQGQSRVKFLASDEADVIRQDLLAIAMDPAFNTTSIYTTTTASESSLFVEKHMNYISNNPTIAPQDYVANLRLRTRIR